MKKIGSILILTLLIFIVLTLLTMQEQAASDGFNVYGFPFVFYNYTEGKITGADLSPGFKPVYFILDILFCVVFAYLIIGAKKLFQKKNKK